jgi:hypothetical protein
MILHQSVVQYQVYLKAIGTPSKRLQTYQQALINIEYFYGPKTPLDVFDESLVLEYIRENDPFETDPVKVKRGEVFCNFTHWLMKNRLIPAWSKEMHQVEKEQSHSSSIPDNYQVNDNLIL